MARRASSPVPQLTMPGGDARRSTNNAQFPVVHVDCLTFNLGEGIPASSVSTVVAVHESARSCPPRGKATTCGHCWRFVLPIRSGLSNRLSRY